MAYSYTFREGYLEYTFQLGNNVWCDVREPYIERTSYNPDTGDASSSVANCGSYIIDRVYGSGAMFDSYTEIPSATAVLVKTDGTDYTRTIVWNGVVNNNTTDSLYIGDGVTTIAERCFASLNDNSQEYEAYWNYSTGQ